MLEIYCADPVTGRRGLLIEVLDHAGDVSDSDLANFSRRLFHRSIRVGVLMTPKETVVVRDALSSMKFAENEFSRERFSTSSLFEHISLGAPQSGAAFELQVRKWIEAVAESWFDGLPPDAVRAMVPDVIGHITGAVIEEHRPEHRSAG